MQLQRFRPFSLRLGHRLAEYHAPAVMGIVNVTPDSFYGPSRAADADAVARRVEALVGEGADMLDVGACSTRPGSSPVEEAEETDRLGMALEALRSVAPDIPVSVDTFRASVAREAVSSMGADMVNDISGGDLDPDMFATVASLGVPYILMHMRGTPATMQTMTDYPEGAVAATVGAELSVKVRALALAGVADVIVDPGFGFAKTLAQNYELLDSLGALAALLERPILAGMSRKSMLTRLLDTDAGRVLPATVAVNMAALLQGASILRVHDVGAARQAVAVASMLTPGDGTTVTELRHLSTNPQHHS